MKYRYAPPPQRATYLWLFVSMALTLFMVLGGCTATGTDAFHQSYDLVLLVVAFSLLVASIRIWRHERLFACSGFLCFIVALLYLLRPVF